MESSAHETSPGLGEKESTVPLRRLNIHLRINNTRVDAFSLYLKPKDGYGGPTYFMNKGRQGLLVAAATADKETVDGSAVTVRLHGQLVRE